MRRMCKIIDDKGEANCKITNYKYEACVQLLTTKVKHVYNYSLQRRSMCEIIDD